MVPPTGEVVQVVDGIFDIVSSFSHLPLLLLLLLLLLFLLFLLLLLLLLLIDMNNWPFYSSSWLMGDEDSFRILSGFLNG